tara:strand:+ start:94 stop:294 length:201 start_codon:yes stop_codon:yes gene_type:complete
MSQTKEILNILKSGRTLTALDALRECGCMRLAARILEIRDMGYDVLTTTIAANGKRFAGYKLIEGS